MNKVFISGVAGFVGSHLTESLLDYFEVIGIDNLLNGKLTNLKNFILKKEFNFLRKDVKFLRDENLPSNIKIVYHLAVNHNSTYTSYIDNIQTTKKMLEIARKKDAEKFVFMSSTKAMGLIASKKPLDESTPCKPYEWYGKSKLECERLVKDFCETYGIKYYIFRPPRIFGPRDWQKTFADFSTLILRANILPLSPIKINLIYVKNLVETLYLVSKRNAKSGVYIVSDGAYSISQISLTIAKILGKRNARKIKIPSSIFTIYSIFTGSFTHARRGIVYSSKKFRKEFNFKPPYTFYRGMKETLIYFGIK
ncbi:MAG: NAD(P)-dependent oxidoreductase [Candidatus Aenigmarchaeota archaeon]|jgi:nucleoside-diphosphate-sugar epimerase|nr:NAD(P)-dependent oxidoreductase [Candidatus Aenigmarchaeota archaeon]